MTLASNTTATNDPCFEQIPRAQTRKSPSNPAATPRKRRKRTVVSGAADDCFTCAKRSAPCDRRRPYCSQCLDQGNECSGYKTTLTWGVGVASRGKLRGMSLPVTEAQPSKHSKSRRQGTSSTSAKRSGADPSLPTMVIDAKPLGSTAPSAMPPPSPGSDTSRNGNMAWMTNNILPGSEGWSQTPAGYSPSPSLVDSGESLAPNTPPFTSTGNEQINAARAWSGSSVPPTTTSTQLPAKYQTSKSQDINDHLPLRNPCPSVSYSQLLLERSVGRTPRYRYLISYYAQVIAPTVVAFDSPSNPFRTHILRLAQESNPLQDAIATLSASNLRQRRERKTISTERTPASRMSCKAHHALVQEALRDRHDLSTMEIAQEEQHHRWRAVKALNAELADPHQRLSDSVLATLLILCLFHICDTGVAQFKAQFSGVTKLLALRMRSPQTMTDDLKWFIRMFTWFDTMTATTNDRESHLRGTCLDITSLSDGDWGLENLAGCDASLFRLIAQLGRLNLLSRHQKPQAPTNPEIFAPTVPLPPSMTHHSQQGLFAMPGGFPVPGAGIPITTPPRDDFVSPRPTSPAFWTEWFALRQKLEAWRYVPRGSGPGPACPMPGPSAYISPPSSPSSPCGIEPQNYSEILHVSESFRHSAILYCERLAYPELPSSHPRIQNIVQAIIHHITAVQADVYLLWPLFIAGSECVVNSDRNLIRQRCQDISRDSGFCNNLSCLELLENIWAQNGTTDSYGNWTAPAENLAFERGFRWQQAMRSTKRADDEYMMV